MPDPELPQASPSGYLASPAGTVVEPARPALATHPGPLPAIIAAADRAAREPGAPLEIQLLGHFLLHQRTATTATEYARDVAAFARWCWTSQGISLLTADRGTVEVWVHQLQAQGTSGRTLRRRLAAIQGYYLEALDYGALERVPTLRVKRPRLSEPVRMGISREEASLLLEAAEDSGPRDNALVRLLLLNGLRASEACGLRVGDIGRERGHRTVTVHRKGGVVSVEAVSPGTSHALDLLLEQRGADGDAAWLFTTTVQEIADGGRVRVLSNERLSRHGVARVTRRLGRAIGTADALNPHELRHAFITLGLDAGATLRDLQRAAAHADPRTTANYDRRRKALDTHPSYLVERYLA
jgi:integrase/recombinase XerD